MNNSKNAGQQDNTFESRDVDSIAIESLIASFSSKGVPVRIKARQSLIAIGGQAVAPLVNALANRNKRVRWEASKALGEIGMDWGAYADSATITALIADLGSKDGLVRVRARKSLVAIGIRLCAPWLKH